MYGYLLQVEQAKDGDFLGVLNQKWQDYKRDLVMIRDILMYLVSLWCVVYRGGEAEAEGRGRGMFVFWSPFVMFIHLLLPRSPFFGIICANFWSFASSDESLDGHFYSTLKFLFVLVERSRRWLNLHKI